MAYTPTNWQNLPSTSTPVNATNLNKVENQLALRDNIAVTKATSSVTLSATGSQQIPITGFDNSVGNKFTVSNNRVYVGAGVTKVLVSANLYANLEGGRGGAFNFEIKKNGTTVMGQTNSGFNVSDSRNACLSISPVIVDVAQNDYFEYFMYGYSGDVARSDSRYTCLTIQAIA